MKKIYFLAISIIALNQTKAQTSYTLTQANSEPIIGDFYDWKTIDTTNALPMTISGSNVTWNVTGITETGVVNSNTFTSAASNTAAANYPGTTLIQTDPNSATYFKSSANSLELLGADIGIANLNYNMSSAIVAQYPMALGHTHTDLVDGAINAYGVSGPFNGTITVTADATGTLIFNGGTTFSNCIRIKAVQYLNFSLAAGMETGTIEQTMYSFFNSSSKFHLFSVNYTHIVGSGFQTINQTQAQMGLLSDITIGVKETQLADVMFKASPNPAQNEVNLHFVLTQPESYSIEIANILGQTVKQFNKANFQPGIYNETLDLKGLTTGLYYIKMTGKNSQGIEKIIIQ